MMLITRRHMLAGSLAAVVFPCLAVAQDAAVTVITAEKSEMQLLAHGGGKTPAWRFDKDQAIAVLRAKQGQEFKGRIVNHLDEEIWLHWFGVRSKYEVMTLNVLPGDGNAVDFSFIPPDAGTFWFGPLSNASKQRDMGLYGMLIVEEAAPLEFRDVPLILDDWMIDDAGQPTGTFGDLNAAIGEGRMGNWFTVNGGFKPHIKIDRSKPVRLRILNAANVRQMDVLFKGADLYVMALDGQPVPLKALGLSALKLAPGQRADLLLSEMHDDVTIALDLFEDVVELGYLDTQGADVPHDLAENFMLSPNPLSPLGDVATARQISIVIAGGAKGGLKSAKVGDRELDMRALLESGLAWAFNGIAGAGGPSLFEAKRGETLVLVIENTTSFPQPIHTHGHVWQQIEGEGQPLENQPWRDTAVVPGLSKIKLAMVADNVGVWALQSLVAERVDSGLLGSFTVTEVLP
jgi:FtsP/CotA-like multicopper oxidase with cupredoxin domain